MIKFDRGSPSGLLNHVFSVSDFDLLQPGYYHARCFYTHQAKLSGLHLSLLSVPVYTYRHDIVADFYILLQLQKSDIVGVTFLAASVRSRKDLLDLRNYTNFQADILLKNQKAIMERSDKVASFSAYIVVIICHEATTVFG